MGPARFGGEAGGLEAELDRHPQHVEIGEVHHLAVEIGAPVAVDHHRQEQPRDQEEVRHPERFCERDQDMHETGLAGGQFDPQHRMHHHHHDDADALGVIDPVDAAGRRCRRGTLGDGGCAFSCHRCPFSARRGRIIGRLGFILLYSSKCHAGLPNLPLSPRRQNALRPRQNRPKINHYRRVFQNAHRHDWHGLCGTGFRRLLCRFRPPGHLRGQGFGKDRGPAPRRNPDFRARARCAGRFQREGRAARFCHRSEGARRGSRRGVHRGRHAVAAWRRPCRSELRACRRA